MEHEADFKSGLLTITFLISSTCLCSWISLKNDSFEAVGRKSLPELILDISEWYGPWLASIGF